MNFNQNQNEVDALLATYFSRFSKQVHCWRKEFDLHQCVRIGNLIPPALRADLHAEARRLLAEKSERRNVQIASTGNTGEFTCWTRLYEKEELRGFLLKSGFREVGLFGSLTLTQKNPEDNLVIVATK